ncbi:Ig-like domain-containing protein [Carnobacterium maltaromaticum]|uniref:Ig-like domain-containing protein n=1 Tax=Carnobacterium maltaromaticum TaxID=2751 RepID=UPI00191BB8CD|nr:Ig-like domain-containing protein [Carnobacterium maltaromaticum]CAD5901258.1 conserved exported hypothetical protein [Carnobacterium maltaromaticum]
MKRSEFKKLTKSKKRNAKVVKMVTTTGLSIALIAPSILGSISALAAEETVPTEQVETVHEAVQIVGNQAPIQAKAQSYTTTVNWVVNQNDANVSFDDGLTGTLSGTDNLYFATETSGFNTGLNGNQVGTQTFTFTDEDLGNGEGNTYTITLVVTNEPTTPEEKPQAPQSISATDDGKFVYASAEQGTSIRVKDANGTPISTYTVSNGLDTPVQINLNRALTKGEKVQVVAVNQMTDKQSDPTWFTFKAPTEVTNKVIGIDLDTSEELYSYNETGLEGETKEVGYSTIEGFELAEGETPIKIMTFGVNGDVTFYYTKKIVTTPEDKWKDLTFEEVEGGTILRIGPFDSYEDASYYFDYHGYLAGNIIEDTLGDGKFYLYVPIKMTPPVDPTEPTEPTNPVDPTDPTDPSTPKPVEPTNPTEPSTPNPVVPTTPSTTDTTKPVTKVDDKKENLIPQLGETSNMLTTIGMIISASMGLILTKRKR